MVEVKTKEKIKQTVKEDPERKEIKSLLKSIDKNWCILSRKLYEVYASKAYIDWGFEDFEAYTEKELQLAYRSAMYKVKIGEALELYNIDDAEVVSIGWTKFKELLPYLSGNQEAMKKLFKLAKKMTVKELQSKLKRKRNKKKEVYKFSFSFTPEQASIIEEALELGKALLGTDNKSRILEAILADWIANQK